jgi:hypothetical protein
LRQPQRTLEGQGRNPQDDLGEQHYHGGLCQRLPVAQVAAGVGAGQRVAHRPTQYRQLSQPIPVEVSVSAQADDQPDPAESHQQARRPHPGDALVLQPEMGQHQDKERHGSIQDGGHARVDPGLAPGDQSEWQRGVQHRHDSVRGQVFAADLQSLPGHPGRDQQCQQAEQQAECHQRHRPDLLHGDLDPQERRPPDETQRSKCQP